MAVDKLVDSAQLDADLGSVADAIRTKGGTSAQLAFPSGFVSAVEAIETGGGGGTDCSTAILSGMISGRYENNDVTYLRANALSACSSLTFVSMPNLTNVGGNAFYNSANIEGLYLPKLRTCTTNYNFSGIKKIQSIALPSISGSLGAYTFANDTLLSAVDLGANLSGFGGQVFASTALTVLVLRTSSKIVPLNNINNFNSTPFSSGGTGGTLYVPSTLISAYQSATNWSAILGYENNQILPIEGSIYENTYADGTPISA